MLNLSVLRPRILQWQQQGATFLRWWLRELVGLLPESWRGHVHLGRDELVLRCDGTAGVLERRRLASSEVLARFEAHDDSESRPAGLPDASDPAFNAARLECRRVLELTRASGALVRDITLPQAASANLQRVLEYEMDRHTPFPASRVHFGYRLIEQLPATGQIRVRLVVIPREMLDAWLLRLSDWGLYPEAVRAAGESDVDLLPADLRRRRGGLPGPNVWLAGVIVLLIAAMVVAPWWLMRDRHSDLRVELERLQSQAVQSQELRERQEELRQELTRLPELKAEYPPLADSVTELARILPDHTWLTTFQFRGDRLTLHGESDAASGLIALIEASPYFERTSFTAPVSRDDRGRESFQLTTRLRPMAEVGPALDRDAPEEVVPIAPMGSDVPVPLEGAP
ncbi:MULTISPECIES: PilN domain-containing protein [unclassified Thioalkalivibrio]|uniref:PilN domain-containing protein n=1 Tax=unclassified Thioalkalivibrio TaxID=2621013 RepID=UPI000370432F|nr:MULTISPECIES: PilN domain-containing protein [unclassified Thioalkalivibrio]